MNTKLRKYLDSKFADYKDAKGIEEIKEQLFKDLHEKLNDLKDIGLDEEEAFRKTVQSIGDISEIVDANDSGSPDMQPLTDFSKNSLEDVDLRDVELVDGVFEKSTLKGADFSFSNLSGSTFGSSDLRNTIFEGTNLTGAKIIKSSLQDARFGDTVLDNTLFDRSDLSGVSLDGLTLKNTEFLKTRLKETTFNNAILKHVSFKNSRVKEAVFDGAMMDKMTYALLEGYGADLQKVTVI